MLTAVTRTGCLELSWVLSTKDVLPILQWKVYINFSLKIIVTARWWISSFSECFLDTWNNQWLQFRPRGTFFKAPGLCLVFLNLSGLNIESIPNSETLEKIICCVGKNWIFYEYYTRRNRYKMLNHNLILSSFVQFS